MTDQILTRSGARPRATFYADGSPIDLDSGVPTVTITKPNGSTIASGTVSHVAPTGSGTYEFTLAPLADPTLLTITWAGPIGGVTETVTTYVEVVGALLYNLGDLRAVKVGGTTPFTSTTTYPNATLQARRTEVTEDFEARTGYSFVPRFTRETHDGNGTACLQVRQLRPTRLLSVTIDGVAQSTSSFTLSAAGELSWTPGGWFSTLTPQNVVVEYIYGFDRPPPAVSSAGLARTAMLLLPSQAGSTVSSWTTPDGTTYAYDQSGQRFQGGGIRHYGVPAIDSVLNSPSYTSLGAGVA